MREMSTRASGIDRPEVILSSTVSDSHTWNLWFLHLVLEELGCDVANLGACVPPSLLVQQCDARRPSLIVLSSVNGHGYYDGQRAAREVRRSPILAGTPLVIGGKLGISEGDRKHRQTLLDVGFDVVFSDTPGDLLAFRSLVGDIVERHTTSTALVAEGQQ